MDNLEIQRRKIQNECKNCLITFINKFIENYNNDPVFTELINNEYVKSDGRLDLLPNGVDIFDVLKDNDILWGNMDHTKNSHIWIKNVDNLRGTKKINNVNDDYMIKVNYRKNLYMTSFVTFGNKNNYKKKFYLPLLCLE